MKQLIENTRIAAKKLLLTGVCFLVAALLTGIGTFTVRPAPAQSRENPKPSFDVASVKPSDCRSLGFPLTTYFQRFQPGRYSACDSLEGFIIEAYSMGDEEMEEEDILGGPDWIDSDSDAFSIEAKAEGVTDRDTLRLMLQSLLEERFRLKTHYETREQTVLSLVVAKGGHKLKEARDENGDLIVSHPSPEEMREMSRRRSQTPFSFPEIGRGKFRGIRGRINPDTGQLEYTAHAVTMPSFAHYLTDDHVDRTVFDKTGLKGYYDFELHFARNPQSDPRDRSGMMQPAPFSPTDPMPSPELSGPSIFTAIQEQLGLKLEADKAPLEFLVIDSVERPTEN